MSEHETVISGFLNRLVSAVSRSALLKATVSRTGRLLDCSRLAVVDEALPGRLLECVVSGKGQVPVALQLRPTYSDDETETDGEAEERPVDRRYREHRSLYDTLDRRIQRFAELVKRETGVHSLWLGYPFLHLVTGERDTSRSILAPIFLWPASIQLDHRHEGRILIGRDAAAGSPKFNRAMARWIARELELELDLPSENELDGLTLADIRAATEHLRSQFSTYPTGHLATPLEPLPNARLLSPQQSPRLYNSAVLGIYRWQNDAIIADLESLKAMQEIEGVVAGFVSGRQLPCPDQVTRPPESDRYQVYDADFSQERVIWQARSEPGLVVHGPPGTGKSQTIVNVIADALAHGRTVLMVCQKYAATRVVFEKLKQVGLHELCLEVPDGEKCRVSVFKAIRTQVEQLQTAYWTPNSREAIASEIEALERELDNYAQALHEKHTRIGISYREMKTIEGMVYSRFPTVRALPALQTTAASLSSLEVDTVCREVEQLGRLFKLADPMRNPWRHHQPNLPVTVDLGPDVQLAVEKLRQLDEHHLQQTKGDRDGIEICEDTAAFRDTAQHVISKFQELVKDDGAVQTRVLRAWLLSIRSSSGGVASSLRERCDKACDLADQVASTPLPGSMHRICAEKSAFELKHIFAEAKVALGYRDKWWRALSPQFRSARQQLQKLALAQTDAAVWTLAEELLKYERALGLRTKLLALNAALVPGVQPPADEYGQLGFPKLALAELDWAQWLRQHEKGHTWLSCLLAAFVPKARSSELTRLIEALRQSLQSLPLAENLIGRLDSLALYLKPEALAEPKRLVRAGRSIEGWLDALLSGLSGLGPLIAYTGRRTRCSEPTATVLCALEDYESRRSRGDVVPAPPVDLPPESYGEWWVALVKYAASLSWQAECQHRIPELVEITPELHTEKVAQLKRALKEKRELEASSITAKWKAQQIQFRNKPWTRWFQLRAGRGTKAKRLREAVELSLNEGLLAMRPCWLVNPATVAEIFPLAAGIFDVVIFDEASQCPVEQAVPAVYRGKVAVVSGDEKQLPPTSFFQSRWSDEELPDENEDQEATQAPVPPDKKLEKLGVQHLLQVEDLLSAAIGNLPERHLSVHYRSKHPALVEFSNRAFYYGRLESPPARISTVNGYRPIQYYDVSGLYEQRTNHEEARHVIKALRHLWKSDGPNPTIGVVTFNQPQRDLIEDLLEQECGKDPAFGARYRQEVSREDENQDVGFFVKNLENVQGDERDVMIFSTTFGRDGKGQFRRYFGPVGAVGGERRLNVAVTRAKQQVIVVSSMPIERVSSALALAGAPGSQLTPACYLQLYLAYAKAVSENDHKRIKQILNRLCHTGVLPAFGAPESPFEEDVRGVLERLGYTVHSQVGDSGFRIDLGVLAADPKHGYLLGVECDGATYHSDRAARLRDVWRENILRQRGWRLHRIWSTRWWYYRGEEIEKLKAALEDAAAALESQSERRPEAVPAATEEREAWQMPLAQWKKLREELQTHNDTEGLRRISGLGTEFAHRAKVQQAVEEGKSVPGDVLVDYPDLRRSALKED